MSERELAGSIGLQPYEDSIELGEPGKMTHVLPVTSVITWLDSHQGAASVFLTAALICVTIFYAIQNLYMVKEMRRSREMSIANREREEHRERLRDLRSVTDVATAALRDLWSILGTFMYAIQ